jgi:hypothetical protein
MPVTAPMDRSDIGWAPTAAATLSGCKTSGNGQHAPLPKFSPDAMRQAQIFISHSTKTPRAKAYLLALQKAFTNEGRLKAYWLDRRDLKPGDKWRSKIFKALRESHAAVLLLSKEALEQSDWVQIEASYLCVQEARPVFPILIDVEADQLKRGVWEELRIDDTQAIKNCKPTKAAEMAVARLKAAINLDSVAPRNSWEKLRGLIADDLADAEVAFHHVEGLCEQIKEWRVEGILPFPEERIDSGARTWLADSLMRCPAEYVGPALRRLYERKRQNAHYFRSVLDRLAPHWADEETALAMGHLTTGDREKRQFGISTNSDWTIEVYACRARTCALGDAPRPLSYPPIAREREAASIDAEADSIAKYVIDTIKHKLSNKTDNAVRIYCEQQEKEGWPVLLSFAADWWPPPATLLTALRKRLESVALCFKVKDGDPSDADIPWVNAIIRPSEDHVSVLYDRVKEILSGNSGGRDGK